MKRFALIFVCVLATAARAGETGLSALVPGKRILGPAIDVEALSGRVVMAEFWGTR